MAAEPKYKALELEDKVDEYFRRCRRTKPVTEQVPMLEEQEDGQWKVVTDDRGKPILLERSVQTDLGEPMRAEEYLIPPTITGLCLFLGISRETWSKYSKDKAKSRICERAKMTVEIYLQHKLLEKDSSRGAQFALEHNFGWKERKEVSADEETRTALASGMSAREKLALLKEMGLHMPGEENAQNDD